MATKYTKEILEPIVARSISMRQVILELNLKYTGGNYSHIKSRIEKYGIDMSHLTGQGWSYGKKRGYKKDITEYLKLYDEDEFGIKSNDLKKRLLKEKLKEEHCEICGLTEWNGKKIPLHLHHKDGNGKNNVLENLQIICPNCHAQTENYSGKKNSKNAPVEEMVNSADLESASFGGSSPLGSTKPL